MKGFFVILITSVVMAWLTAQARNAKATRSADVWRFPVVTGLWTIYIAAMLLGLWLVVMGILGPLKDRAIVVSIGSFFIFLAAITWPKTVELSNLGLRQRSWLWGWKTIHWNEALSWNEKRDGSIIIRTRDIKIIYSPYHAGRKEFLDQIQMHRHR